MIVGGQPSLRRYCVFSNLFAAAGDGQIYRLDMHPTMANHPVTPMSEADLRQILVAQGLEPIGGIHLHTYNYGIASVRQAVESLHADNKAVLFDVHHQSDLALIGQFMHEQRAEKILAVGPSSVAEAYLSGNLSRACTLSPHRPSLPRKPVFILAGSRSQVTASQVEKAQGFVKLYIHPADLEHDRGAMLTMMSARCLKQLGQGNHVLAIVSNDMKHSLSRVDLAYFTADLISKIAFSGQVDRLGIAGGDTSSLALQRLGMKSLSYTADIEPGLCLCRLHSTDKPAIDGLEIVLKGGQMGSSDLFTKLTGLL